MQRNQTSPNFETQELMRKQLLNEIEKGLPPEVSMIAYNISRSNMSVYSLLCRESEAAGLEWLTLRTADHPTWLKNAQQMLIDFGSPADLSHLSDKLKQFFADSAADNYYYRLTVIDLAILHLIDECQQHGIIWAVRLPEEIFSAKKRIPLDLNKEFIEADLFLGDRNNLNSLLLPVHSKKFQTKLAELFGRNLLFSQFSGHFLLKLLPTNQWIQPMIKKEAGISNWKEVLADAYGQGLIDRCERALENKI